MVSISDTPDSPLISPRQETNRLSDTVVYVEMRSLARHLRMVNADYSCTKTLGYNSMI